MDDNAPNQTIHIRIRSLHLENSTRYRESVSGQSDEGDELCGALLAFVRKGGVGAYLHVGRWTKLEIVRQTRDGGRFMYPTVERMGLRACMVGVLSGVSFGVSTVSSFCRAYSILPRRTNRPAVSILSPSFHVKFSTSSQFHVQPPTT